MADSAAGTIRVGVGGWTFEPWRETFYPAGLARKRELEHASRQLTTLEVNGTYYRSQTQATFARWRDETPDGFVLSLKAPRFATNRRVLAEAGPSIARFLDSGLGALGDRLGPINWQFMATKTFDPEDFEAFLALLPPTLDGRRLRHAVELRHPSFAVPGLLALARARGVAVVVAADGPHPQIADPTADFVYLRIMGTTEDAVDGYGPGALDAWAARARTFAAGGVPDDLVRVEADAPEAASGGREVFVYVIGGHKPRNPAAAQALLARLGPDAAA